MTWMRISGRQMGRSWLNRRWPRCPKRTERRAISIKDNDYYYNIEVSTDNHLMLNMK